MRNRRTRIVVLLVVTSSAATGAAAAAPPVVPSEAVERAAAERGTEGPVAAARGAWEGLAARVLRPVPAAEPAAGTDLRPRRLAPRRAGGAVGCQIDPNGCRSKGG